jgi:hypothetical protein
MRDVIDAHSGVDDEVEHGQSFAPGDEIVDRRLSSDLWKGPQCMPTFSRLSIL